MNPHTVEQPRPAPLPRTIVTGASSGIGRALALHLASLGVPVVALGRDAVRLQSLAAQHLPIHVWPADLARIGEIDALAQQIVARFPDVGVIIHNAGIQHDLRMDDAGYGSADIQQEVDVNLVAPIALTRALLPHLQGRHQACVVNVTSALAHAPKRTAAVYSATKAGLRLFTQALRVQLRGSSVRVVDAVMPLVDTPMTQGRGRGKLPAGQAAQALVAGLIAGRSEIHIGKARWVPALQRWAPGLLARILQNA